MKTIHTSLILATALLVALSPTRVNAQSAAISFQGQLGDGGRPATGQYDFVFRLFDAASGGAEQAQAIALNNRGVTNGYFTVPLDFGIAAYSGGGSRFIQMEVRTAGTQDGFVAILPRTAMTPVPFALFALSGNAGPKGDKGDTGAMGPQGPQGLQGIAGAKGDAGLNFRGPWSSASNYVSSDAVFHEGATWVAKRPNIAVAPTAGQDWAVLAAKGDAGPQGLQGLQGVKGDTGAMGPQGLQGLQGLKGDTGAMGPQGPQGLQGIAGAKGDAGLNFRGPWSSASNYVSSDAVFHEGATWVAKRPNIAVAPTAGQDWAVLAAKGDAGPQGLQGLQGVKGDTGAMGPQGLQGLQGLKGDTGAMGPQGPQGLQGIAGAKGDAGLNFRGPWSSTENYNRSDAVYHAGASWVAKRDNINVTPIAGEDWALLAAKGDTGPQGVADAPTLANIPRLSLPAGSSNTFDSVNVFTRSNNLFRGRFGGDGAGLSNLPPAAITGILAPAQLPMIAADKLTGTLDPARIPAEFVREPQLLTASNSLAHQIVSSNAYVLSQLADSGSASESTVTALVNSSSNALSLRIVEATNTLGTSLNQRLLESENVLQQNLQNEQTQRVVMGNSLSNLVAGETSARQDALLSAEQQRLGGDGLYSGSNRFAGVLVATNATNQLVGSFAGSGAGLSNLPPAALAGVLAPAQLPMIAADKLTGTLDPARIPGLDASKITSGTFAGGMIADGSLSVTKLKGSSPQILGHVTDNTRLGGAWSVTVAGTTAYVASYSTASLTVIDVSNSASPHILGRVTDGTKLNGATSVTVAGTTAYVASVISDSLTVIDVSNPASPQILGHVTDTNKLDRASSVTVAGTTAYVASSGSASLTVIDVSNPASPQILGHVTDSTRLNGARSVTVVGTTAYVASWFSRSLAVIDVSNSASPQILGHVTDNTRLNGATSVTVAGTTAYVASGLSDSLTVIDVSNPASPQIVGHVTDAKLDVARSVTVAGTTAYVASDGSDSLTVIDVSNPASPQIVGHVTDSTRLDYPRSVTVAGTTAYVASHFSHSLTVIDVSAYTQPVSDTPLVLNTPLFARGGIAAGQLTGTLDPARIPGLDASKITSGTLSTARIPELDASKITSGTIDGSMVAEGTIRPDMVDVQADAISEATDTGGVAGYKEVVGRFSLSASAHSAISVDAQSGRDSIVYLAENGSAKWSMRNDVSDSDKFQIRRHLNSSDFTAVLTINTNKQVGIGTSPGIRRLLHAKGTDTTGHLYLQVENTANSAASGAAIHLRANTMDSYIATHEDSDPDGPQLSLDASDSGMKISFRTQGTERAKVTSSGLENVSDRNLKQGFAEANYEQVLRAVEGMPVQYWSYKDDESQTRHLGPVAQDFQSAFAVGQSDRSIAAIDADGVSLAAIKGLSRRLQERDAEVANLKQQRDAEVADLKARLAALEALVQALQARQGANE